MPPAYADVFADDDDFRDTERIDYGEREVSIHDVVLIHKKRVGDTHRAQDEDRISRERKKLFQFMQHLLLRH